jgi:hypothetical protein
MRPAGARASNPPTVQTGLWADLGPKSAEKAPKNAPPRRPETLAEENARLRARVAALEAVAESRGPARRSEAAQLPACSCAAAPHVAQRLEQHRATILGLETLVERQARALDATDADGASTEEILDRLARALRGVADLGHTAPYHEDAPRGAEAAPASPFQSSLLRTVEALRGRADASKRERRDAALGLDSDAARDRREARRPVPPRALRPPPSPSPRSTPPSTPRTPSPPSQLPGDSRPAWDDEWAGVEAKDATPPPAPAPARRPRPRAEWKGDF